MQDKSSTTKQPKTSTVPSGDQLVEMMDRRIEASKAVWGGKYYKIDKTTEQNESLYLGHQVSSEDDGEDADLALDNRIFSSIRTIVPYVTSRITEPEICPSSNAQAAKKFAEDIEQALYIKAKLEKVREKTKFSLEDAVIRRRGYLKPRYDPVLRNFFSLEYVPAESIVIDHLARPYEEPRYFRHCLKKSIEDLMVMFPDMADKIKELFAIDDNTPKAKLEEEHTINEDWLFVPDPQEGLDLLVVWSYKTKALGQIKDPNWRYGESNFLPRHMVPLIFFNVLSDGRTYIDKTSFVEQAKYLQQNVDARTRQINKNAGLGSVGMPVVDSSVLADDQAENLTYEPDTVLELDLGESGKTINDVFTQWKASPLPQFVYEDKLDSRNGIDNAFGTPNVFRGEQSTNNTLGQDVLIRDQAFGRQQEIVDAIDAAMSRLYLLMAQFLLVYGNEEELFRFNGEDGNFDYILIHSADLDTNIQIQVKAGSSMPIDRAQRRATADKAAQQKMIDPLTYWEIMDEGNADKYAKRLVEFMSDPASYLKDTEEDVFNRDAFVDIQLIKTGQQPPYRDDLPKEYFDYLNHYVLSGDLDNPTIDPAVKQAITTFIDTQLARGQRMLGMAQTQLPTPDEVTAANQQTDQLNQQDQQAADSQTKQDTAATKNAVATAKAQQPIPPVQ